MPPSPPPPEFFLDRRPGRVVVAEALREAGCVVHTMVELFGEREEQVLDAEWLAEAGREGWIVLTKDKRIRRRAAEIRVIDGHGVSAFVLARGSLGAVAQAEYFVVNLDRIVAAAEAVGACVYEVHATRIQRVWPRPDESGLQS